MRQRYLAIAALWALTGACLASAGTGGQDADGARTSAFPYSSSYDEVATLTDGRTGRIAYRTLNRATTIADLQAGRIFLNDMAKAILTLPDKGRPPYAVMVIAHSSAGVQPKDHEWADWFNRLGVATLVVDTFGPRGIGSSASNQSVLSYGATIGEYLLALKLLATHPAIDVKRAGIIGFSRGGVAAMAAGIESIRKGVIGGELRYAAHFPVYGGCYFRAERWTGAPMHLSVGTEDSYENIDICGGWQQHAKGMGIDAALTVFPGVHHGFDDSSKPELRHFPNAERWQPCKVEWNVDTRQFRTAGYPDWHPDRTMAAETAVCSTKGVTVKYDAAATNRLKRVVESMLRGLGFIPDGTAATPEGSKSASSRAASKSINGGAHAIIAAAEFSPAAE